MLEVNLGIAISGSGGIERGSAPGPNRQVVGPGPTYAALAGTAGRDEPLSRDVGSETLYGRE